MVADEIALENKERQSEGGRIGADITNGKTASVQMDGTRNDEKKSHTSPTHTREQVAKLSGVGVGTVARYDAVMKSEDEILADLIETNIRQRGIGNPNPVKLGRCIKELERIYGIQHGNNQYGRSSNNFKSIKTQEDLAQELGVTIQSINNYKKLAEMIPELEELI